MAPSTDSKPDPLGGSHADHVKSSENNRKKETPLKKLLKEKPGEVLKKAVYGMLPKNKLRAKQIKRLRFENFD